MARPANGLRLFGAYALASALPIALLGVGLSQQYRSQTNKRALDQAASEAEAIANAGIEPIVGGRDLKAGLTPEERSELSRTTAPLLASGDVLRLRLRDSTGVVVFDAAHPNAAPHGDPDDEVQEAAEGRVVRQLTRLNEDQVDSNSAVGPRAVEAYLPIRVGGNDNRVVGVLEMYLPYAPLARSAAASSRAMTIMLVIGLAALWLILSGISWSVTQRLRKSAAENEYQALHDQLTGLPNRALFADRADHAIAAARRSLTPVGIAIVDIDRFKEVNDTLGHHNGDRYLCEISRRLREVLRGSDTVARLGGDEFGLVLSGVDASTARVVLERIQRALAVDIELEGVPVTSEASIGVAFWPIDGKTTSDLLQRADLAMHAAKQARDSIVTYAPELAHFSPARLALISELRHAINADELVLHYQPKLDLRSNRISSVEALLRWQHPKRGLLLPGEFLDIAESTGLIDPLTDWVLAHAIEQTARWHREGLEVGVAVNISARNLRNESLATMVQDLLAQHEVDPAALKIELTETALIADPSRAAAMLGQLRDLGVGISLDDFGRGYTSLSQLGTLPLCELKIDASFVGNMLTNSSHHTIVNTVIELGHNLALEVVAEGAETDAIVDTLSDLGCDVAQGWALTPALDAQNLSAWVRSYERQFVHQHSRGQSRTTQVD